MTHRTRIQRFLTRRISFQTSRKEPVKAEQPSNFRFTQRNLEQSRIDTNIRNLLAQLRAKRRGKVPSSKPPTEFINPLNIAKTRSLNRRLTFRGLFNA